MSKRRIAPLCILAGSLILTITLACGNPVGCFADTYRYSEPPRSEALAQALEVITFDPDAEDPFDNTIRTDLNETWQMIERDDGLGLEAGWFIDDSVGKSRWLLTDMLKVPLEGYRPVFKTDGMAVYQRIEE